MCVSHTRGLLLGFARLGSRGIQPHPRQGSQSSPQSPPAAGVPIKSSIPTRDRDPNQVLNPTRDRDPNQVLNPHPRQGSQSSPQSPPATGIPIKSSIPTRDRYFGPKLNPPLTILLGALLGLPLCLPWIFQNPDAAGLVMEATEAVGAASELAISEVATSVSHIAHAVASPPGYPPYTGYMSSYAAAPSFPNFPPYPHVLPPTP